MKILTIDTSSELELIVAGDTKSLSHIAINAGATHATTLIQNIDTCLQSINITIHQIEGICAGIGPGSFTGIRIGVATARMLAQALDIPIVGIHTPLLFAHAVQSHVNDNILIAFDAKKGKIFGALYCKDKHELLIEIVQPGDYTIETILNSVNKTNNTICIGNGIQKYEEEISENLEFITIIEDLNPDTMKIYELSKKALLEAKETGFNSVLPFYARKSDAEIIKEMKNN